MTPPTLSPAEEFREALGSGRFLITAELESPRNASAANVARQAEALAGLVDAIDCTDNSAAVVRMSPAAAAAIAIKSGLITLIQLTCRDRNRIALQSELLGAAASGAAGVICIGGDPPAIGNYPEAPAVYDLTTIELLHVVAGMREGRFASGAPLRSPVDLVAGCVENPADGALAVARLAAKAEAGAELVQTQMVFDIQQLEAWMELVRTAGLQRRLRILVGIAPVRTPEIARRLNRVPGVSVPEQVISRLESADEPAVEGVRIAAELLRAARQVDGVGGVHLLTFGWAAGVRRALEAE